MTDGMYCDPCTSVKDRSMPPAVPPFSSYELPTYLPNGDDDSNLRPPILIPVHSRYDPWKASRAASIALIYRPSRLRGLPPTPRIVPDNSLPPVRRRLSHRDNSSLPSLAGGPSPTLWYHIQPEKQWAFLEVTMRCQFTSHSVYPPLRVPSGRNANPRPVPLRKRTSPTSST
jgi:hypothetical protein